MKFSLIIALDNENGIGKNNDLAWSIPEDMKHFKDITTKTEDPKKQNAVIMGRKTWESIPEKYRPLKNRYNCVLSRGYEDKKENEQWGLEFSSLDSCLRHLEEKSDIETIYIIWWAQLYNQIANDERLEKAYITRIYDKFHCDSFFDWLPTWKFDRISRSEIKIHEDIEFEFVVYERKRSLFQKIKRLFS